MFTGVIVLLALTARIVVGLEARVVPGVVRNNTDEHSTYPSLLGHGAGIG